jgi:hypothetical protein
MAQPEIHPPHRRRSHKRRREEGLPRWLEMAVAVTALVTSISSIAIAVEDGKTMNKLVKANSIPYLVGGFSDVTPEENRVLSLDFVNAGVGPAHEESLRVKVHGRYVRSSAELIATVLGSATAKQFVGQVTKNGVRTRFVPGGASQMVFKIPRTAAIGSAWDQLRKDDGNWDIEYCYCSVFNECWAVPNVRTEPQAVKQCTRDEPHEFLP